MDPMRVSPAVVRSRRWSPNLALACVILFLVCMAGSFICMERYVGVYDEALILFGAQRVGAGDLPHRDFYANYGPGSFYVLSWLFKLFSPSVLVERVWDSTVRSAIVVLVVLLVRTSSRGVVPWAAGLVTLLWLMALGFYSYPIFPVLALALASALALVPIFAGNRRPGRLVLAGALMGGVALFRYDAGVAGTLCTVAVLMGLAIRAPAGGPARAIGMVLLFLAGLMLVVGPVGVAYLVNGMLPDFWFDVVQIPARVYVATRGLPPPGLAMLLSSPIEIGSYLPLLIAVTGAIVLVMDGRQRAWCSRFWLALQLQLLTLVFIGKGYVRYSAIQMGMALVTSVALLGCLIQRPSYPGRLRRAALAVALGAMGLGTLAACRVDLERAVHNAWWLVHGADCSVTPGLDSVRCFSVDPDLIKTVSYIRRLTEPGTPLFVGLGRHDKILENDVLFYFLADRPSATKWHHMDPGVQTTEPIQREMVAELRAKRPPFVVLDTTWDGVHEPNDSALSSGVTILDDYIRSAFRPVEIFGTVQVWRRDDPPAPAR